MSLKIYTKTGDKGKTFLLGGEKVDKSDLQIEAYGNVDELNSFVGLLQINPGLMVQQWPNLLGFKKIFSLGSILACSTDFKGMKLPEITIKQTRQLENGLINMKKIYLSLLLSYYLEVIHRCLHVTFAERYAEEQSDLS